ncbi:MAG: adenine deaminase [Actinobacteria bacterium]|nr:MAG: adenine deaminase [Actinomycetota bacterium]
MNAYLAAGVRSDHECTTYQEALEKRRLGMWIMIREGSAARNLEALLPLVQEFGPGNCLLCTDDREPDQLLFEGHINHVMRKAVSLGCKPYWAVVMATLFAARYHRLHQHGAVAPGFLADIVAVPHLEEFRPVRVWKRGRLAAADGKAIGIPSVAAPDWMRGSVRQHPGDRGRGGADRHARARRRAGHPRRPRRGRPRPRSGQDRGDRAAPPDRPDRPGVCLGLRASAGGPGLHPRARRPQHRRGGRRRRRYGDGGEPAGGARGWPGRRGCRQARGGSSLPDRGTPLRSARRGGGRRGDAHGGGLARPGGEDPGAVHGHVLPRSVRGSRAEDHGPGPGRYGSLRAGSAPGLIRSAATAATHAPASR